MPSSVTRTLAVLSVLAAMADCPAATARDVVRVRLFELDRPASVEIAAAGGDVAFFIDNAATPVATLSEGERVRIAAREEELYAAFTSGGIYAIALHIRPVSGGHVVVAGVGERVPDAPLTYDGSMRLSLDPNRPGELLVVNEVDLEQYVAAVVDKEYGLDELEGAKALAVAVRTYTLRSSGKFGDSYDHVDHVLSQVYRGTGSLDAIAVTAARETAGEVLTHRDELIEAVYFASSGGHTADNELVWEAEARPYLRGKPDPFDVHPERNWQSIVTREDVLRALSTHYDLSVEGFLIEDRSRDGRAHTIALLLPDEQRRFISGAAFRQVINRAKGSATIRSTNFTAVRRGETYLFEGVGAGHGVGLPQWGAYGMARRGRTYRDILSYYYTDVSVRSLDDLASSRTDTESVASAATDVVLPVGNEHDAPPVASHSPIQESLNIDDARPPHRPRPEPQPTDREVRTAPASSESARPARIGW